MKNTRLIGWSTALLAGSILFFACKKEDAATPEPVVETQESSQDFSGKEIFTQELSNTAKISFHELDGEVMITIDGHIDDDESLLPNAKEALTHKTLADVYTALFSTSNSKVAVPQALLDLDAKYKTQELADAEDLEDTSSDEDFSEPATDGIGSSTAKVAAIDWTKDANWFKSLVRSKSPSKNERKHYATNKTYAWKSSKGYYHMAFGMAASQTKSAKFQGWWRKCPLFKSCRWESHFSETIKPRHWRYKSWLGSEKRKNRKFRIEGIGSNKRVHLGVTWSEDRVYSTGGGNTSSSDLSAHISSFSKNRLSWYVKNNGSTTLTRPWVTFTYYGTNTTTDTWQIPATLRPGQTYGDTRYSTALSARLVVDSKNLIRESNEVNNITNRSNSIF